MTKVGGVGIRAAPQYYRLDTSICNGNTDTVRGLMATEWVSFKQIKAPTFACIHERRLVRPVRLRDCIASAFAEATADKSAGGN